MMSLKIILLMDEGILSGSGLPQTIIICICHIYHSLTKQLFLYLAIFKTSGKVLRYVIKISSF